MTTQWTVTVTQWTSTKATEEDPINQQWSKTVVSSYCPLVQPREFPHIQARIQKILNLGAPTVKYQTEPEGVPFFLYYIYEWTLGAGYTPFISAPDIGLYTAHQNRETESIMYNWFKRVSGITDPYRLYTQLNRAESIMSTDSENISFYFWKSELSPLPRLA